MNFIRAFCYVCMHLYSSRCCKPIFRMFTPFPPWEREPTFSYQTTTSKIKVSKLNMDKWPIHHNSPRLWDIYCPIFIWVFCVVYLLWAWSESKQSVFTTYWNKLPRVGCSTNQKCSMLQSACTFGEKKIAEQRFLWGIMIPGTSFWPWSLEWKQTWGPCEFLQRFLVPGDRFSDGNVDLYGFMY
jgi:hypothetical protein